MEKKPESLTAADFFEKLHQDKLDTPLPFSIIGMVKKSKGQEKTIEFAPGGNCSNWVTIPLEFIEDVEIMKTIECKDHTHPLVKLNMITPKTPEGNIFFALLESMKRGVEDMQHSYNTPERGYPGSDMEPTPSSTARLGAGGLGGLGGGGLNSWGCWSANCCVQTALVYRSGGWVWVCVRTEPCQRCIWPW